MLVTATAKKKNTTLPAALVDAVMISQLKKRML